MTRDNPKAFEERRELTPDELDTVSGGAVDAFLQFGASNPAQQKPDGSLTTTCCAGKHLSEAIITC
jgi:hypothetical protein